MSEKNQSENEVEKTTNKKSTIDCMIKKKAGDKRTKTLIVDSLDELKEAVNSTEIENDYVFKLSIKTPLTQEAFVQLSESSLGHALEELQLHPEYDDRNPSVIDTSKVKFPNLKRFDAMCQAIHAVYFIAENFPLLKSIDIEQPCAQNFATFHTDLPNLDSIGLQHVVIDDVEDFGPSLSRSPKLRCFFGYKIWGLGGKLLHTLVLPNLTTLNFWRSDDLRKLKLWAPKLEEISLQGCYDITNVQLLSKKPRGFEGPDYEEVGKPSNFEVNCVNASVPKGNLVTSERCIKVVNNMEGLDFF